MTKEERKLLIKDLCARFPYGVMCRLSAKGSEAYIDRKLKFGGLEHFINGSLDVKPYLRPMSSMTEEEVNECYGLQQNAIHRVLDENGDLYQENIDLHYFGFLIDFYHSHYLDHRGLIPMGLALEAPKDMYKKDDNNL